MSGSSDMTLLLTSAIFSLVYFNTFSFSRPFIYVHFIGNFIYEEIVFAVVQCTNFQTVYSFLIVFETLVHFLFRIVIPIHNIDYHIIRCAYSGPHITTVLFKVIIMKNDKKYEKDATHQAGKKM